MRLKLFAILIFAGFISTSFINTKKVLVFTKTEGFRHESIETGVEAIKNIGKENQFEVFHTEDASIFTKSSLAEFDLVIFLNTTGNILNEEQQSVFEEFIKNGGSFMGIHSASDTEYDWPWYGKLVGAYFLSHPAQAEAKVIQKNDSHESTKHLPKVWTRFDEWYNYKNISPEINVLLELDETSYTGGENGSYHPIAWYQEYDGGRMFYTGGGHTISAYSEPHFKKHLLGGINYCLKRTKN